MIKVLTFNKLNGDSEIACIESHAIEGFDIKDAIKRLVNDDQLNEVESILSENSHTYIKRFESEFWVVLITKNT